ncbi:hypothetical protein BH23THE1_BH23THE1_28690 [soil metagenome]
MIINCFKIEVTLARILNIYYVLLSTFINTERVCNIKVGRNSYHSTTWVEWSQSVVAEGKKGNLIIIVDQHKTCYSFLYRFNSLMITKAVMGALFRCQNMIYWRGSPQ